MIVGRTRVKALMRKVVHLQMLFAHLTPEERESKTIQEIIKSVEELEESINELHRGDLVDLVSPLQRLPVLNLAHILAPRLHGPAFLQVVNLNVVPLHDPRRVVANDTSHWSSIEGPPQLRRISWRRKLACAISEISKEGLK